MATIAVKFKNIKGDCTIAGHQEQLDAIGMRETVEIGIGTATRQGKGRQSDIELIRYKDRASPKLVEACVNAADQGVVTIHLFQTSQSGTKVFMEYKLADTYVSRIEYETLDEGNYAFQPHLMAVTRGLPTPGSQGLASALEATISKAAANSRLVPLNIGPAGAIYSNLEIERVFLNANKIQWTYTPYDAQGKAGGKMVRGFDLHQGQTATISDTA